MELEKQVCSLELAQKLKELGVKQESAFWWSRYGRSSIPEDQFEIHYQAVITFRDGNEVPYFSAFTVAELGEMLAKIGFRSGSRNGSEYWCATLVDETEYADTEANARAQMLVYLLENDLLNK